MVLHLWIRDYIQLIIYGIYLCIWTYVFYYFVHIYNLFYMNFCTCFYWPPSFYTLSRGNTAVGSILFLTDPWCVLISHLFTIIPNKVYVIIIIILGEHINCMCSFAVVLVLFNTFVAPFFYISQCCLLDLSKLFRGLVFPLAKK